MGVGRLGGGGIRGESERLESESSVEIALDTERVKGKGQTYSFI